MTLEIRKTLLPPDMEFNLDGASESHGITAAADIALRLYGSSSVLDKIWEKPEARQRHDPKRWRQNLYPPELAMEKYAAYLIRQLPPARQIALVERGILSICHDIKGKAEWLAHVFYEDATKGGMFIKFKKKWRVGYDMRPTPRLARALHSRARIRRFVRTEEAVLHVKSLFREIGTIVVPGHTCTNEDRESLWADLNGQLDTHRIAARAAIENARWEEMIAARDPNLNLAAHDFEVRLKPGAIKKAAKRRKEMRRATKRAAMLAAAVLGASSVSAFARGEPVMLNGPDLSISATLKSGIDNSGHGVMDVGVHADGKRLASLCVYQDMPALDQLVSLAMHVQSGNVDDVMKTGNLFAVQDYEHPAIVARGAKPLDLGRIQGAMQDHLDNHMYGRRLPQNQKDMYQAGLEAYLAEMMPIFEEEIAVAVFGPASKIWKKNRETFLREVNG